MADVTVGFRYLFGIHMGLSRGPVDEIVEIKVGEKVAWRGSATTNQEIAIDAYNLFGGEEGEGGVQGTLTVMMGGPTQTAPAALATVLKTPMPGFRRMCTVFFDGIVTMMNPYPKPWSFRQRRALAGWDGDPWYPEKAVISLLRPVSEAETAASTETANLQLTSGGQFVNNAGVYTLTFPHEGTLLSVQDVTAYGDWQGESWYSLSLIEGTHYTRVGNVLTLIEPIDYFLPQYGIGLNASFGITYTATVVTSSPSTGLGGLGDAIIKAMNPAHIIYECYTNREWGRGLPREMFDDTFWRAAADRLFSEQFGLCLRWNRKDTIDTFIQNVLDHISGVIYPDRKTGKLRLSLIRDGYRQSELPLFDPDTGLLEISENTVGSSSPMINEVKITYRDPLTNQDRTQRASNIASVQAAGGVINSTSIEFTGLPLASLASRVAKRELRLRSQSLRRFTLSLDRRGFNLVPGGLLRIQDLARGIPDMVLRIGSIDYGSHNNGRIRIIGVQDVFGMPAKGYTTIGPPTWTPPNSRPCIADHEVFELPYRSLYRALSSVEFNALDADSAYLGVVCQEGNALNAGYDIAVRSGAPTVDDNPPDNSYVCGV
jgi:hypothetical protein